VCVEQKEFDERTLGESMRGSRPETESEKAEKNGDNWNTKDENWAKTMHKDLVNSKGAKLPTVEV